MGLFNKELTSLKAVKGLEASAITAEQIEAINTELEANELNGIEVSAKGSMAEAIATLTQSHADQIAALTADLEAAEETIATLKEKPAATPTAGGSDEDEKETNAAEEDLTKSTSMADLLIKKHNL